MILINLHQFFVLSEVFIFGLIVNESAVKTVLSFCLSKLTNEVDDTLPKHSPVE